MEWPADPKKLSRRSALKALAGTATAGALAACSDEGGRPRSARADDGRVFQHGVASGDPMADRVILWTRLSGQSGPVAGEVIVYADPGESQEVGRAEFQTDGSRDWKVKVDFTGLAPQSSYYYRFVAAGMRSPLGRTRTAASDAQHLRFAVASCAKYHQAHWNSYAAIARMADLDAVIHLGDYIYEETSKGSAIEGRALEPDIEIYTLAEYRERHAYYQTDPDLQEMQRQHPLIAIWDDHEIADNCYYEGAHRHFEDQHGPFPARRAAAVQAFDEWMPIRTQPTPEGRLPFERIYRQLPYGTLCDLTMIDPRLIGRDAPTPGPASDNPQPADPLAVNDAGRSILGGTQRAWFEEQLASSQARWKLVGNAVMFGQLHLAPGLRALGGGTVLNTDQWDGYRAEQNGVLDFIADAGIEGVTVLTGDIHSAWAIDLSPDPHNPAAYLPALGDTPAPELLRPVAVEFVTPGVGRGAGSTLGDLIPVARELSPHIRYAQGGEERGFLLLDLSPDRLQGDWYFTTTLEQPDPDSLQWGASWYTGEGAHQMREAAGPTSAKPNPPPLAP